MAYQLPHFNLVVNVWRAWNTSGPPPTVPPTTASLPAQLYVQLAGAVAASTSSIGILTVLRVPKGTDIRVANALATYPDLVECPAGSRRFYSALEVEDAHKGFPNEYRICILSPLIGPTGYWPQPLP